MGFDWVKARAQCSLGAIFQLLAEVLDSDIKSANELQRMGVQFTIKTDAIGKLIVHRATTRDCRAENLSIIFELSKNEIRVHSRDSKGNTAKLLSARPELTSDGECLLKADGHTEPLKLWQFSKAALEDLLFGF